MAESKLKTASGAFGWSGFAWRWISALALVLLTYNPMGWSYIHWISEWNTESLPLKALAGLVLTAAYFVAGRAAAGSLGNIGSIFFLLIFAAFIWLMQSKGWFDPKNATALTWVLQLALSIYLALGMTASFLWKRLTGQVDIAAEDHVDHNH